MKRYNLSNLVRGQLYDDDPEVGSTKIEQKKLISITHLSYPNSM
jgi:hypothetical protein